MVTLSKIAKLAHVSVSTVSKAFSMSREVNEQTREEIFKLAKELGCFKKYYNAKYPRLVIGVVCPEFGSLYYAAALSAIESRLDKYNCDICVAATNFSAEKERELLEYYSRYTEVDGIIGIDGSCDRPDGMEIPVIRIGSKENDDMRWDLGDGIRDAVLYLKENGAATVGYIGETHTDGKQELVSKAFFEIYGEELDGRFISVSAERFERGGYLAMENLFKENNVPRVVICAYDYMAIGAMRRINERGLRVPDDIAVIGMDNISEAGYMTPSLSSVDSHAGELCELAADRIIELINGKDTKNANEFRSEFIARESSEIKK